MKSATRNIYSAKPKSPFEDISKFSSLKNDFGDLIEVASEKYSNDPEIQNAFGALLKNINDIKKVIQQKDMQLHKVHSNTIEDERNNNIKYDYQTLQQRNFK